MLLASTSPISCAQQGQIEIRSVLRRKSYRWQKTVCMAASKPLAVISGTARDHGIGRECAKQFLEAGYKVVGLDNVPQEEPALQNADYDFRSTDITSGDQIKDLASHVKGQSNELQVLINNAGIADPYLPENPSEKIALWHKVIQTNLTGAFLLSEALLPHMIPGRSSIIHMSSIRAKLSEPNSEAYGAAKAGLIGLTHAQAVSLAKKVRVNAVLPGWIYTMPNPEDLTSEDHDWHPAGRVGVTNDVAQLCLFLADSKRSGFITGQEFVVDGGVGKKLVYPE